MADPAIQWALVIVVVGAVALLFVNRADDLNGCPDCSHCRQRRDERTQDEKARRHDYQHKGGGWREGDPDRMWCDDKDCERNPRDKRSQ